MYYTQEKAKVGRQLLDGTSSIQQQNTNNGWQDQTW